MNQRQWHPALNARGEVLPLLNKLIAAALFYCEAEMSAPTQTGCAENLVVRLDVESVQGSLTKEIGFYAERASIHNTPKPKVKAEPSPAIFDPSLFLINPKLAKTSAFDSMTDEFAVVNVKRNGLLHLISPISHCE